MQLPRRIVLDEINISGRQEFLEFLVPPLERGQRFTSRRSSTPCICNNICICIGFASILKHRLFGETEYVWKNLTRVVVVAAFRISSSIVAVETAFWRSIILLWIPSSTVERDQIVIKLPQPLYVERCCFLRFSTKVTGYPYKIKINKIGKEISLSCGRKRWKVVSMGETASETKASREEMIYH